MPTMIPPITFEDHPAFTQASAKLQKLHARLAEIEERQRAISRETEDGRAEAAQAELDAVLRDDACRRDPKIKRLREMLKALDDEAEDLQRTEAVLRIASSEQHKVMATLREEARRPVVAAAVERWRELLSELETFTPHTETVQQAFNSAVTAQGRMVNREDTTWSLTTAELARLRQRTEGLVTRLREAGYDV